MKYKKDIQNLSCQYKCYFITAKIIHFVSIIYFIMCFIYVVWKITSRNIRIKYCKAKRKRLPRFKHMLALKRADVRCVVLFYLELVYLVTALVPSLTACLANSPGKRSLTAVCISREVIVDLLL